MKMIAMLTAMAMSTSAYCGSEICGNVTPIAKQETSEDDEVIEDESDEKDDEDDEWDDGDEDAIKRENQELVQN